MTISEVFADDALVRIKHLASVGDKPGMTGLTRSTLYRMMGEGRFPQPVRPLPGVVAWRMGDVRQWLRAQVA